jgi:mannose/cellobiose epimerase-like protein (N-acyl-D-glucosamine 2-epimerase family)
VMQAMVNKATPHHTSARRWVMVRAMKSLARMNEATLNTKRRQDANSVAGSCDNALRRAHTTARDAVASALLSG